MPNMERTMPKADAINNTPRKSTVTLSAVAAALGEIEPPEGEMQAVHFRRLDALRAAASHLPICTADDAALALSCVSDILGEIHCYEMCEEDRNTRLDEVSAIHTQIVRWLIESHGARPLRSTWAEDFEARPAAA